MQLCVLGRLSKVFGRSYGRRKRQILHEGDNHRQCFKQLFFVGRER